MGSVYAKAEEDSMLCLWEANGATVSSRKGGSEEELSKFKEISGMKGLNAMLRSF